MKILQEKKNPKIYFHMSKYISCNLPYKVFANINVIIKKSYLYLERATLYLCLKKSIVTQFSHSNIIPNNILYSPKRRALESCCTLA